MCDTGWAKAAGGGLFLVEAVVSVVCVPTPLWCGDGVLPPPVIIQAGSIGIPWRGGVDPTTIDRRMSLEDVRWCVLTCVCDLGRVLWVSS